MLASYNEIWTLAEGVKLAYNPSEKELYSLKRRLRNLYIEEIYVQGHTAEIFNYFIYLAKLPIKLARIVSGLLNNCF